MWVDPIDGTNCFVRGEFESVTIIVGLAVSGEATLGIVYSQKFRSSDGK